MPIRNSSTGMKGVVLFADDAGNPIAVSCKVCGSFTLDTESCLCTPCYMGEFIKNFANFTNFTSPFIRQGGQR